MALAASGVFFDGARTIFGIDSTSSTIVPADAVDASKSLGGTTLAGTTNRLLVNSFLPTGVIFTQSVIGAETNTFTARTAIQGTLLAPANYPTAPTAGTFPVNTLNLLGRTVRFSGGGNLGTTVTPNYTFDIGLGAGVLATTGALAMVAATSPANFWFVVTCTTTTLGAAGVVTSSGCINIASATNATATWAMANTVVGTGLTADLTAALAVSFNVTSSASSASNRFRLTNFMAEVLY